MKHFRPRLSRRAFWVLCALLVCLRLALTGFQQAYIWVGGAPLDDELMFRAANHITAGQWLGAYDYLTLSKAMFFPVWLALLHALHLPYLISGAALWWPTWVPSGRRMVSRRSSKTWAIIARWSSRLSLSPARLATMMPRPERASCTLW